jgi:integrase
MAQRRTAWPIGQCRVCLGWGEKPRFADCVACSSWRQKHPEQGHCRRCRHGSHLNTDGLCRLCLRTIRLDDPTWVTHPSSGRPCQLMLILPGDRLPTSQPLNRPLRGKPPDRARPRSWTERLRVAGAQPADDPRVLPATIPGQLALVRPRRRILEEYESGIRDRVLRGQDAVRTTAFALADEHGFSTPTKYWLVRLARLMLAARDADGEDLVPADALDDLPRFGDHVAEALRRSGLLGPRRFPPPIKDGPAVARGCLDCGCWGIHTYPRCGPCHGWRFTLQHPAGLCVRCRRNGSPVRADNLCRACSVHIAEHGPHTADQPGTQLWIGGALAPKLQRRAGHLGYKVPRHRARQLAAAHRPPRAPVSPHLVDPAQGVLFDVRRDWSCVTVGSLHQLPALTPSAEALLAEFHRYARSRRWEDPIRDLAARSLRIVLAWVGADAPIHEADLRSLPSDRPGTNARRIVQFLAERGLLIPDPDRQIDIHQRAIDQRIQTLPAGLAEELRRWVQVLRGQGRRRHPALPFHTIRKYLGYAYPVLQQWGSEHDSLREISPEHIENAMGGLTGHPAGDRLTALRSLFRALKQERLIFRDPTRGFTLAAIVNLPTPIPTDRLRGLIDRADGPLAKLVVALIAVHGLGKREVADLLLADLDLASGKLVVRRAGGRHVVHLDELTHQLTAAWLRERHRRWPTTPNPHLLINQQTADMDTKPPVSNTAIYNVFRSLGVGPAALRRDRILDEARHTADPVHLMRVFGISATTALDYIYAAHPERRSTLPR